jgi:hypothetical protein
MNRKIERKPRAIIPIKGLGRLALPVFLVIAVVVSLLLFTLANNTMFSSKDAFGYGYGYGYDIAESGGGAVSTASGTTFVYNIVTISGNFTQDVIAKSGDAKVTLNIPTGVTGKTSAGAPLTRLDITPMTTPPAPPADKSIIGLAYDFGPAGATFDPPITITFSYDPANIPAGVNEKDLTIAFYDTVKGTWVVLEGIKVDPVTHTISGQASHFTAFTVISPAKAAPAPTQAPTPTPTATAAPTQAPGPTPTATAAPTQAPTPTATVAPAPTKTTTPATTAAPAPTPTPKGGNNWWILSGIIVAVIIVAGAVMLIIRRRG